MKIRTLKIESMLIPISEELKNHGYEVDKYESLQKLKIDGLRVVKEGTYSAMENMIGSKWLCGVILYNEKDLILNLREETPYSEELFRVMRKYFKY